MKYSGHTRRRKDRRLTVACLVVSVLVGGALGFATDRASGADCSLSVRVRPSVAATFTDEGVVVHSNTPWLVEATGPGLEESRAFFTGGPTGADGTSVPVGPGESIVSVVPR